MNLMLWQLEIHEKSNVEHINEDTQCKICSCTPSLKLKACFHVQIKSVLQKLFFYQIHAKKHLKSFGIWESHSLFSFLMFPKILLLYFDSIKSKFQKYQLLILSKACYVQQFFLFKSQKKLYIIYNYINKTKYIK